jgi:hypothetical protein
MSQEKGVSFSGPRAVSVYQCLVVASALELYAKTGMKANRMYTPTNMLAVATKITGQTFKGKTKYTDAAAALRAVADAEKAKLERTETDHHVAWTEK